MPGLIQHFAPAVGLAHPLPPLIAIGTFDVPWSCHVHLVYFHQGFGASHPRPSLAF